MLPRVATNLLSHAQRPKQSVAVDNDEFPLFGKLEWMVRSCEARLIQRRQVIDFCDLQ